MKYYETSQSLDMNKQKSGKRTNHKHEGNVNRKKNSLRSKFPTQEKKEVRSSHKETPMETEHIKKEV